MRKQQLKFKRKAIFYLKEAFIHSNTLDTRSAQQVIPIRRYIGLGRSLLVLVQALCISAPPPATTRRAAIMRCTRPLTTPTAGVSFVHSRRSRRSSLGDNLVPAFTGAVRSSVRCTPQQLLTTLCRRSSKNLRLPRLSSNPANAAAAVYSLAVNTEKKS